MDVTSEDIAWAAGLFEGEGSASSHLIGNYRSPCISLAMTDEDVVRKFYEIIKVGTITNQKGTNKQLWKWSVSKKSDCFRIEILLPYLSERRKLAIKNTLNDCIYLTKEERRKRLVDAQAKLNTIFCVCGKGPMRPGPYALHAKACPSIRK